MRNNDSQLHWDIDLRDLDNDTILGLGGWNELGTPGDLTTIQAKPNGVDIKEWFYRPDPDDQDGVNEWNALEQEASFSWPGFDWDHVGIVIRETDKDDYDGDGIYRTQMEYDFIKIDPNTGRQDWDYFSTETVEGSDVTEIRDGNGDTLGYVFPEEAETVSLKDAMGSEYGKLGT